MEPFDRFATCLAYYWYACEAYQRYAEQCEILARLEDIGFRPGAGEESSPTSEPDYNDEAYPAWEIYQRLIREGYDLAHERRNEE